MKRALVSARRCASRRILVTLSRDRHCSNPFLPFLSYIINVRSFSSPPTRCVAERNDSHYCQGYTFTQRPLRIGEKLVLQVLQTDELYAGSIAFGLTTCDPNSITGSDLPEDPHQLLDRPEYWVVIKDVANGPQPGDEIAFKITPTGKVQLFKNRQQPVTLMHVDASQKFHAFFDLYGSTIKIKALGKLHA